jgi:phosphohistidine phosphatase
MSRILYLVRHAQSESGQSRGADKERALTHKGQQDSIQLGEYLIKSNSNINLIISSPAIRALSTAYLIAGRIKFDLKHIQTEESVYSHNELEILKLLNKFPESTNEVLLVGHYPTIVELYNYLAIDDSKTTMNAAELFSLKFDPPWSEVTGGTGSKGSAFFAPLNII